MKTLSDMNKEELIALVMEKEIVRKKMLDKKDKRIKELEAENNKLVFEMENIINVNKIEREDK